jgi:hypothetical protein
VAWGTGPASRFSPEAAATTRRADCPLGERVPSTIDAGRRVGQSVCTLFQSDVALVTTEHQDNQLGSLMLEMAGKRALLLGATGYLGRRVARVLIDAGCSVAALAREPGANAKIEQIGARPVLGSLEDLSSISAELTSADVIVVVGRMPYESEEPLVESLGQNLDRAAGQTFVFTSGTGVLGVPAPEGTWDQRTFSETTGLRRRLGWPCASGPRTG